MKSCTRTTAQIASKTYQKENEIFLFIAIVIPPPGPDACFSSLKHEIGSNPHLFDLLGEKLSIGIVAMIVVHHDPKASEGPRPRPFETAEHIRVDDPVLLLQRLEVRRQ